ncbi:hypothetical protein DIPPA_06518 [Diplonema papillatum]|nr:hypothetical protein DIPPA_06518 [Diplonema papillatum]
MLRHALRMRPSRVLLSCRRRQASAAGPTAAECGPEKRGWAMVLGTGNLLKPKKLAVVCLAALASYLYVVFPWYPLWKISTTVSRAPEVWIDRKGCLFSSEKAIKSLIDYWMVTGDEISQGKKRSFMLFLGPNGVGKSTTIERAIAGRRGVVKVVVNVEPGKKVVVEKEVARSLGLDPQTADLQGFLMNLNSWLRWLPFFGCPLLLYVDVQVGNKNEQLSYSNCARIANSVRAFGRKYSYDQPTCPVVVEVSVLQIGDVLSQRVGSICEKLQIFPMSRAELFELFEKKHGHNRGWKQILGGAGYRDGLDLFYIKIGGNMRELEAIMNQSSVPDDFLHSM